VKLRLRKDDGDWIYRRILCKIESCPNFIEVKGNNPGHTPRIPWAQRHGKLGAELQGGWAVTHAFHTQINGKYINTMPEDGAFCPEHRYLLEQYYEALSLWNAAYRSDRKNYWLDWISTPLHHLLGRFAFKADENPPEPPWEI